jgi:tRNA-dihydrouridine synthase B
MGIPFEKLTPPKWGGPIPAPVTVEPMRLGSLVIDPPVVLSPMAAVTNPAFRLLCREMGAGLVVTEMIYARGLIHEDRKSMRLLDLVAEEHPVSVQLFGKDPNELAEAARRVQAAGADAVDLNMGCPMRKVVSSGHGAALLREPERVYDIFKAMSDAVDIPVTGKTRAGWENTDVTITAQAMEAAGAAAITVHGRTRCDMYDGHADLGVIRDVKQAVSIPVIGNGDVSDWISARRMFRSTGCDGVMVARGCLGNPWVFQEILADLRGEPIPARPSPSEKAATLHRHVDLYIETAGLERVTKEIRKHLLWYFRATPGEKVLRTQLASICNRDDIERAIDLACSACMNTDTSQEPKQEHLSPNRVPA